MADNTDPKGLCILLGAGAGDSGLLTLEGQKWLARAEVVVYDRLVSADTLAIISADAEKIYVGKCPDHHAMTQGNINDLLVEKTLAGKLVVRLKGGDPLLFGRGGEEAGALSQAGCDFRIVPGMTAALVAGAYSGISLTDRRCASTVAFVTGHEDPAKDQSSIDYKSLAGIDTLVFYMGMGRIAEITAALIAAGRDSAQPVAVVQNAGRPTQRILRSTLEAVASAVKDAGITPPALLIVGDVTALAKNLSWFEKLPLAGKRIIVTRSRTQASKLTAKLAEQGAEVLELPTIQITPPDSWSGVDEAIENLEKTDLLVFTSPNGVDYFMGRLIELGLDARQLAGVDIAVIGKGTGDRLAKFFLRYDLIPEKFTSDVLADAIISAGYAGKNVVLARSDIAPEEFAQKLQAAHCNVTNIVTYKTQRPENLPQKALQALEDGNFDWITFTSASTAENLQKIFDSPQLTAVLERINSRKVAAIGPVTAAAVESLGLRVDLACKVHSIAEMAVQLAGYYEK